MNIKVLSLLLIPLSLSSFSLKWLSKPQQQFHPKVAVIKIFKNLDFADCAKQLIHAKKQSEITGVILVIDSNGGSSR